MLRKCLLYIFILSFLSGYADNKKAKAPKQTPVRVLLKDARAAIKNKRDQKNKEKAILDCLKRDNLSNEQKAELYFTAAALEHSLNDQENLKAYLKQKYDTAAYYNTMYMATRYSLLCDSVDTLPNHAGKIKARYRNKNRDQVMLYRYNLYQGGRFFYKKNDFNKVYDYMSLYTDLCGNSLVSSHPKVLNDTLLASASYYTALSAFHVSKYENALMYIDMAISMTDSIRAPFLQEYKVRCMKSLKREDKWLEELRYGVKMYPKHDYFYVNLCKYYEDNQLYDKCLALTDSMLEHVQDATIYWYSKSLMYLNKENWMESVKMADVVLQREPEHINALYNKAVSYVNEAVDFTAKSTNDPQNPRWKKDREHLQSLYRGAKEPSEMMRRLRPDAVNSWAPLLYRIYLNLNMGKEFSEIEQIIKENRKN